MGNGSITTGPSFPSITDLQGDYPLGYLPTEVELYRGTNPGTGKEVVIEYLTVGSLLRVSTFYADNEYDVNKPYVFTIDRDGYVTHISW